MHFIVSAVRLSCPCLLQTREQAFFDVANKSLAVTSVLGGAGVKITPVLDEPPVRRSGRRPAPALPPSPTDEIMLAEPAPAKLKRAARRPSKVVLADYAVLRDGSVRIGKTFLHPDDFRWFKDPNWRPNANTRRDVASCVHLVYFAGEAAGFDGRFRIIFVNAPGKYGVYAGTKDDACFERIGSLQTLALDVKAWWLKPGMTIPPATHAPQPGEAVFFPKYDRPYVAGELVALLTHADAEGYVHSYYKRPDGRRVYLVYGVTFEDVDPRSPRWKGVYYHDELSTPKIAWRPVASHQMWWVYHASKYEASPEMRDAFLHWPAPVGGWRIGDVVSIPSDDTGARHVARVCSILDAHHYLVQFPVLEESQSPLTEVYRTEVVLGPHTLWTLPEYKWAKPNLAPPPCGKPLKRPRSPSPVSLGSSAMAYKQGVRDSAHALDLGADGPVLKTDAPGVLDLADEPVLKTDEPGVQDFADGPVLKTDEPGVQDFADGPVLKTDEPGVQDYAADEPGVQDYAADEPGVLDLADEPVLKTDEPGLLDFADELGVPDYVDEPVLRTDEPGLHDFADFDPAIQFLSTDEPMPSTMDMA